MFKLCNKDLKNTTYLLSHISLFIIPISAEKVRLLFQYSVKASQHHPGTIFRHIMTNLLNLWFR